MNTVKDIQSLIQLINSRSEVIVFPIGSEGQQLLDFLNYSNLLSKILCVTTFSNEMNSIMQTSVHDLPLIPLDDLKHFRETALFIIFGSEQYYPNLQKALQSFGCKDIVFVTNEIHNQVKLELQRMASNGYMIMWYMNRLNNRINELELRIVEQNENSDINKKAFGKYKNAFRGKEVVIVGCGPTLNYYEPVSSAVHIGLNRAWQKENITMDYLFTMDGFKANDISEIKARQGNGKIRFKVFCGRYLEGLWDSYRNYPEPSSQSDENLVHFIVNGHALNQILYKDICYHPLPDFWSIASIALRFAMYTYPKRIYLVGCDVSEDGHFYKKSITKSKWNAEKVKIGYSRLKMFARLYYPETEIISINPVGLRGLFKDVYTDEYLKALEEEKKSSEQLKEG